MNRRELFQAGAVVGAVALVPRLVSAEVYTLSRSDVGKVLTHRGGDVTYTLPGGFHVGDVLTAANAGTGAVWIEPVSARLQGPQEIGRHGVVTMIYTGGTWMVSGVA